MKIKHNIIFLGLALTILFNNCEIDPLTKQAESNVTAEEIFSDTRLTREFLNNVYSFLPDMFSYVVDGNYQAFFDATTDNAVDNWSLGTATIRTGAISESSNPEENKWTDMYKAIRKANKFIEGIEGSDAVSNVAKNNDDNFLKNRYVAEARVLRALYHFELMKRYGKIVISDAPFELGGELNPERNSLDEVVEFITTECDAVLSDLPFTYGYQSNIGRMDGATAMALKSRTLLYAASPLFNSDNDITRWQDAASAAKALIDKNEFKLISSYTEVFLSVFNEEIITARNAWSTRELDGRNFPTGYTNCFGLTHPTQNLVDAYEMSDGSKFDWNNAAHAADPYVNRDPRLSYTIFYNGIEALGRPVETFNGGKDIAPDNSTKTGYYVKKWTNPEYNTGDPLPSQRNAIIFRYAEVYLNYAEAMNEAYGPESGPNGSMTALWAINQVRARESVNMPEIPTGLSKNDLRQRIHNERRVELAFENHRYYDIRRWKKGDVTNEIRKVNITLDTITNNFNYEVQVLETNNFEDKQYLFPVPYYERVKAPNLGQNPGYLIE